MRRTCVPPHSSVLKTGDGDDAHLVAVLLAEQRHGAGRERLVELHDVGVAPGVVRKDLLVHQPLDFVDLGRSIAA